MKFKIKHIENTNDPKTEYVRLFAEEDLDIGGYAVTDNSYKEDDILSNVHQHFFKFPSKKIKKGDYVRLYTCIGKPKEEKLNNGNNTLYYYYWGMATCIWNNTGDIAHLFEIKQIQTFLVPAKK